jgi:hypothetical protein
MAMNLKKDLQDVNKALNALSKKVEKMIAAAGKPEKTKTAAKKQPAKKVSVKLRKKAVAVKAKGKSAPETIMDIIQKSRGDVGIETLKKKTGFQGQKLYNTLSILKKRGMVKNPSKGIYTKV